MHVLARVLELRTYVQQYQNWAMQQDFSSEDHGAVHKWLWNVHDFTNADQLLKLLEPIENATVLLQAEDKPVIHKIGRILLWLVFASDKLDIKHYAEPH